MAADEGHACRPDPSSQSGVGSRRAPEIALTAGAAAAVRRGHPWVFRQQLLDHRSGRGSGSWHPGDVATFVDDRGSRLGSGVLDPASPIVARVWSTSPRESFGVALLRNRIERAIELRSDLGIEATTAYRLVHGEGDRAPGLVVDRYGHVAILRLDGEGMDAWRETIADIVFAAVSKLGVCSLALRIPRRSVGRGPIVGQADDGGARRPAENSGVEKIAPLRGEATPDAIVVREHGVPMHVDLLRGQKTGAFLDQRDNRRRVGTMASGRRVLNLFSYAGGFTVHAALGGAVSSTSVDTAAGGHAAAQRTLEAAGVPLEAHAFVTGDVWQFLERARDRGERWDLIVSDPPNMAPSEATRSRALAAYRKLHGLCAAVLADGGILCASSCSSHVPLEDFLGTLDDATLGRGDLRVVEIAGAGRDHPTLASFPEGRYLKFVVLA